MEFRSLVENETNKSNIGFYMKFQNIDWKCTKANYIKEGRGFFWGGGGKHIGSRSIPTIAVKKWATYISTRPSVGPLIAGRIRVLVK
jgi:hypothetical protein